MQSPIPLFRIGSFLHSLLFVLLHPPLFAQRPQLYMTCPPGNHLARGAFGSFQRSMKCSVRPAVHTGPVGKGRGSWYPDIQTPGQHHILDCLIFFCWSLVLFYQKSAMEAWLRPCGPVIGDKDSICKIPGCCPPVPFHSTTCQISPVDNWHWKLLYFCSSLVPWPFFKTDLMARWIVEWCDKPRFVLLSSHNHSPAGVLFNWSEFPLVLKNAWVKQNHLKWTHLVFPALTFF